MTKAELAEAATKKSALTQVCLLTVNAIDRIRSKGAMYTTAVHVQADKVERWAGECLYLSGVDARCKLSSGMLRDYSRLGTRINGELIKHDVDEDSRRADGAVCVVIDGLLSGVRAVTDEYRHAQPVFRLDQTFERLMRLILDGDEAAEDIGSAIYMTVG